VLALRRSAIGLLAFGLLVTLGGGCPGPSFAQRSLAQNSAIPQTNPQSNQGSDAGASYAPDDDGAASTELPPDGETLHIPVGRSLVLTSSRPLRRIYVGNPAVLETFTSGLTEIVLTPKAAGASSLIVWDTAGRRRLYSVSADLDPNSLRASLNRAFPGAAIDAEAHDGKIYLSGSVASDAAADAAFKLASLFSKDVVDSIRVLPPPVKQVEMKLRIVEVDRTKMEQFGINIFAGGNSLISTTTGQYNTGQSGVGTPAVTTTDPLNLFFYNFTNAFGVSIKDLAQRDILQVLAEPTLTTISGVPARFLSGGEFPVPVVQGGLGTTAAITVVYRPYGVKVDFTPTVNDDGSIRLKIAPEVSTLDYTNAVIISGFSIPALATRRAETEVQIRDGQTFMISGLLDHRTTENLARIPGIAEVPILGEFFKSKGITHSITELVLIVTATVVDPMTMHTAPVDPKMATPVMQSQTFDAAGKAAAAPSKPSGAANPGTDKP
jgi:pilus assembly protein CpaC